jgi:hypothetical protein
VVGHILEEDALLMRPENVLYNPLLVVLGLRLGIRKAIAQTVLPIVIGGRKRFVQYLEVVPLHKHPLERRRDRAWYSPQRDGFALCHMSPSLVLSWVSVPDPARIRLDVIRAYRQDN